MFSAMLVEKKRGSCKTIPELIAQICEFVVLFVYSVEQDLSFRGVIDPREQTRQGALACTGSTLDADTGSGGDSERDPLQNSHLAIVRERDVTLARYRRVPCPMVEHQAFR